MRPRLAREAIRSELSESESVVSVRGGGRALIVNAVGHAVLDLCDGTRTIEDIAAFLCANLSVPAGTDVAADVRKIVDELASAGLVETDT